MQTMWNLPKNAWCVDVYEEAYFSLKKKKFINGLNMGLSQWAWLKKTVHGEETPWLSSKEKSSWHSSQ